MRALATAVPGPALTRTSTDRDTDTDLVARVRAGEDAAFERLYERYHRRIAAYIYGMVQDYGRAEDVAQDVFMSALRRMRETDRPIAFKPWVYEIAKNACIDQFRRARRAEEVSYDAEEGLGAMDYGKLVMGGPTPEVAVDQKLSLDHLCGAFSGLSQTHHEILVMRELEGLSYREIGERLGMSRPSVESTLFRARRRLSEEYEELISGERCLRVQGIIGTAMAGGLGARDGRKLAAHVSHCQSCRRHARVAGVDEGLLVRAGLRAKIAALVPLPAFLRRRWDPTDPTSAGTSGMGTTLATYGGQVSAYAEPAVGWVKAAAVAATVAAAGVGATQATPGGSLGLSRGSDDTAERSAAARTADDAHRVLKRAGGSRTAGGAAAASLGTALPAATGRTVRPAASSSSSSATAKGDRSTGSTGTTASAKVATGLPAAAPNPAIPDPAAAAGQGQGVTALTDALDPTKQPNGSRLPKPTPAPAPAPAPQNAAPKGSTVVPGLPETGLGGDTAAKSGDPVTAVVGKVGAAVEDALGGT